MSKSKRAKALAKKQAQNLKTLERMADPQSVANMLGEYALAKGLSEADIEQAAAESLSLIKMAMAKAQSDAINKMFETLKNDRAEYKAAGTDENVPGFRGGKRPENE